MPHRGPCSMKRLAATMNQMPVISTCLLLLLQSQIFQALPTSPLPSSSSNNFPDSDSNNGPIQFDSDFIPRVASSPSRSYDPTFSYNSYRPELDSYRPYNSYSGYYFPREGIPAPVQSGIYNRESIRSNSVYSPQSAFTRNVNKAADYTGKDRDAEDTVRGKFPSKKVTIITVPVVTEDPIEEVPVPAEQRNVPRIRPTLAPLPSIVVDVGKKEHVDKKEEQKETNKPLVPLPSDPNPPPFAPELDPQYERKLYGLGALSLLDQAGPFW